MSWNALDAELDRWRSVGERPTLWWRDDDACRATPQLETLIALARDFEIPLALAVVPAALDASLVAALSDRRQVTPIQHGYAHRNHAPGLERRNELGDHRPPALVVGELDDGATSLRRQFGERFAAVLVPPWNRISQSIVGALPAIGLHGLSTFGPRVAVRPVSGLTQCNAHVDIVDWRGNRAFIGVERATDAIVTHLTARREGRADAAEPTGILTHHLVHDEPAWRWMRELFERTRARVDWVDVATAFGDATANRFTCGRSA